MHGAMSSQESLRACADRLKSDLGIPVDIRESSRSTKMVLRADSDSDSGGVRITVFPGTKAASITAFVQANRGWINAQIAKIPPRVRLLPGASVPILDMPHLICQDESTRFPTRIDQGIDGPEIWIGRAEVPERRVVDFLRDQAATHFTAMTREKAAKIGGKLAAVSVKDTTSRWGSCASSGDIAYSWRIIMAPHPIAEYLVAHEVSHLLEMNHGPRFWRLCRSLSPLSPERAHSWLSANSKRLHRYGPPD